MINKSTRQLDKSTRVQKGTYNKSGMAAQNPLGNAGRLYNRLLLRRLQRDQINSSSSLRTRRLVLSLLI